MRTFGACIPIVVMSLAAPAAQAAEGLDALLRACRAEADDVRRLACYDRIAGPAQPAAPPAAAAPAAALPAAAAPSAAASSAAAASATTAPAAVAAPRAEENFGLERAQAHEEAQRQEEEARALGELEATVTAIDRRADGLMTITLDNGQVWRQNAPTAMFRLREGDPVRIQPGSLKSYIMSGPSNRSTRVTRVK